MRKVTTYGNLRSSSREYTPTRKPLFPYRKTSLHPIFGMSPVSISPSSSISTLTSEGSHPAYVFRSSDGPCDEHQAWTKWDDLAWIVDELEQSIDYYPSRLLQLDSPVTLQLRHPQSVDEAHLYRLGKIFPTAPSQHLSALAAILLAQSYLANIDSPVANGPGPAVAPPLLDKSSCPCLPGTYGSTESVDWISNRAATTMGIHLANATSARERAWALWKRAKAVEEALHVVLQEMMQPICGSGSGRWDELLWRSLLCVVETVEGHG